MEMDRRKQVNPTLKFIRDLLLLFLAIGVLISAIYILRPDPKPKERKAYGEIEIAQEPTTTCLGGIRHRTNPLAVKDMFEPILIKGKPMRCNHE